MTMRVKPAARMLAINALAAFGADSSLPGPGYRAPACAERPEPPKRPETFETGKAIDRIRR